MKRLLSAAALVLTLSGCQLMRPAEEIRELLLIKTPIGSSQALVKDELGKSGTKIQPENHGYYHQEAGTKPSIIGASSFRATLGSYCIPLCRSVTAFWGFNESGALVDIWVWKTIDAP